MRPLRTSGGRAYTGVLCGTWAKGGPAKTAEALTAQGGGLAAARI